MTEHPRSFSDWRALAIRRRAAKTPGARLREIAPSAVAVVELHGSPSLYDGSGGDGAETTRRDAWEAALLARRVRAQARARALAAPMPEGAA